MMWWYRYWKYIRNWIIMCSRVNNKSSSLI